MAVPSLQVNFETNSQSAEWLRRSAHWERADSNMLAPRKKRQRSTETLVLCGHGIAIKVEAGTLLVKNGFTHYPQKQDCHRYFRGDLGRPARIVVLDGSGHLTFDVLDWLAEQDVPLIRVSWTGDVVTVAGGSGYGADREKVDWQRATRADERLRVAFGCDLIAKKLSGSILTLETAITASPMRDRALQQIRADIETLRRKPPTKLLDLLGLEGRSGSAYFKVWQSTPLQWRETKRYHIPEAWRTLGPRATLREGRITRSTNATHPVNAMLNYAYAVAVGRLKIRALADGYDPTIGIMHNPYRGSPAYALDLIEPLRPKIDDAVLRFVFGNELDAADFIIRADGACRLNPQLARHVVKFAMSMF